MTTMNDLIANLRRDDAPRRAATRRTRYAIRLTSGQWAGANNKWLDRAGALTFEFMTTALAYAVTLDLGLDLFSIEVV